MSDLAPNPKIDPASRYTRAMERLVDVVQELSLARDLDRIVEIVRHAARDLTGADGATFVIRDGDQCYYKDEEAIAPLWKGRRFPLDTCISGWAMLNRQAAVIPDIYADERIPVDAYRPTFVKSLVMVPIRTVDPVGAIGNYWASARTPTSEEVRILQALADSTSAAMEKVQLYAELERKIADRTARLQAANDELEAFSSSVSHDLQAPLRHIACFATILREDAWEDLKPDARHHLNSIVQSTERMRRLIADLLEFSRMSRTSLASGPVDMTKLVEEVRQEVLAEAPGREIHWIVGNLPQAEGDLSMIKQVWTNLLGNAVKFTSRRPKAEIRIKGTARDGMIEYAVRDNGAGFDPSQQARLFQVFERLHPSSEFEGTGIGLALTRRIVARHGGLVWAEGEVDCGATFKFSLPAKSDQK